MNCRTNHLHIVVSANRDPNIVREQFKAWCTGKLKELERKRILTRRASEGAAAIATEDSGVVRERWWAERGSCRWINDEESLEAAIRYVRDGQ